MALAPQARPEADPSGWADSVFTASVGPEPIAEIAAAPLGRRFLAGLLDAGVLLIVGCVFGTVFLLAKGYLERSPVDLAVFGFIAAFWIFSYFALFTLVTRSTPGQSVMGLNVCNLDGDPPTRQECLLRAFGYLVSLAALMLGFLWAVMDSDGMAWHDHISATLLVKQDRAGR